MTEKWRDIPGYEGLYEASNMGRIRTNVNKTTSNARYPVRHWKQRIMKQKCKRRYGGGKKTDARVSLWKDGKERTWLVSRLVAMAWCDGFSESLTVNHIDGNPSNNHADNLEWVTIGVNIRHGFENGLFPQKSVILIGPDGKSQEFISMASASRFLGMNNGYIWNRVNKGKMTAAGGYTIVVSA